MSLEDRYRLTARRIISEAIDGIETLSIAESADTDMDVEELEKRVRNADVAITIPTASGCKCLGLQHQSECSEWRMCL